MLLSARFATWKAKSKRSSGLLAGDVGLEPDDRLDPGLLRLLVEVDHPEHVPVVGDGHRLHARLRARFHQVREPDGAVEEAVERVQVQVSEVGWHRRAL